MSRIARIAGWLLLASLVFATLAPIGHRPVSGGPVTLERFGAYAVLGLMFAYGYSKRGWSVMTLVILAAGGLEVLQSIDPTRHGRVVDFLVKASGGSIGVALGLSLARLPLVGSRTPKK